MIILNNMDWFVITVIIVSIVLACICFAYRPRFRKEKFFEILQEKFKNGLIKDVDDIVIVLNSLNRTYQTNVTLSDILEDFLTHMSCKIEVGQYDLIKNIIRIENEEKPYADVPAEEKRILENVGSALRNNDLETVKNNLHELGTVLTNKTRIYKRLEKMNRWSVPLAVISLLFTLLFGWKGVDYSKIEVANKELVQEVKNELKPTTDTTFIRN